MALFLIVGKSWLRLRATENNAKTRMYKQHSIPGFPDGAQKVCDGLYIVEKDGWVQYFLWDDNYFSHLKEDIRSRRFILRHYPLHKQSLSALRL